MKVIDTWLLWVLTTAAAAVLLQSASCNVIATRHAAADPPSQYALALAQICVHEASLPRLDTSDYDQDGDRTDWVRHPWLGADTRDLDRDGDTAERVWQSVDWGYDCWGIHEVLTRGAARQQISQRAYAIAYARGVFYPRSRAGNSWAGGLLPTATEPLGWPRVITRTRTVGGRAVVQVTPHMPWVAARPSWVHAWQYAQRVAAARLPDVQEWSVCERPVHHWGSPTLDHHRAVRAGWDTVRCGPDHVDELTANRFYFATELYGRDQDTGS